jgi:hypothetical protein
MILAMPLADESTPEMPAESTLYSQGADFTCQAGEAGQYCSGKNAAVTAAFVNLQNQINLFASTVGFAAISPDGQPGADTLAAAQVVTRFILSKWPDAGASVPDSASDLSAYAVAYSTLFANAASTLGLKAAASAGPATSQPTPATTDTTPAPGPAEAPKKSNTWLWIGGVFLLAATAGTVGYVVYRRRQRRA